MSDLTLVSILISTKLSNFDMRYFNLRLSLIVGLAALSSVGQAQQSDVITTGPERGSLMVVGGGGLGDPGLPRRRSGPGRDRLRLRPA